ncbi:hypothetical protein LCGC14_3005550 [marine sediment metagenome]|uniref:Uncharacterized protein n=1 Tax=marine sediment metagenome TaxID=412755 RepID=A0A0F8WZM1_9ZZZZ
MTDETTALVQVVDTTKALDIKQVSVQIQQVRQLLKEQMKEGVHYGKIPGCGDKPTCYQPGAQMTALFFGFGASYIVDHTDQDNGHREYEIICKLHHRETDTFIGEGVGCCSTMEGKYRFRTGPKKLTNAVVPKDYWILRNTDRAGAQALIGKGNSTAKDESGVWRIASGGGDKVEHDNPADYWNTCLKMAKKRAYVDAVLTSTAASDIFTQDIEDDPNLYGGNNPSPANAKPDVGLANQTQHQAAPQPPTASWENWPRIRFPSS